MAWNVLTATVQDLNHGLEQGSWTSKTLVTAYLDQIHEHNPWLRAVLQVGDRDTLLKRAALLDDKRQRGEVQGRLHGIPVIIKDNIATHPSLGYNTSAGNVPLQTSKPSRHARIVERLLEAGAIIIGKANLSEFAWWKGTGLPSGWSAVGGQAQSAYVRGGLQSGDLPIGHSGPGGSSSGSAVAVSAGFSPVSIGTETDGSLITPATRAALFTIKPSIGLVSQDGIIPITSLADAAGPMTKSAADLALMLDVIVEPGSPGIPAGGYAQALGKEWSDIRVAAANPEDWQLPTWAAIPEESIKAQTVRDVNRAYDRIASTAKSFHRNVELPTIAEIMKKSKYNFYDLFSPPIPSLAYGAWYANKAQDADFRPGFEKYLSELDESPVRTLAQLVEKNKEVKEQELPPGKEQQDILEKCVTFSLTDEVYNKTVKEWRSATRENGIDMILQKYNCDVILAPADGPICTLAGASGYPIATLPLGILDFNGRPFGLAALASRFEESKLVGLMSAWETTFNGRVPPPSLSKDYKD